MCGIVGVTSQNEQLVRAMNQRQQHRGPDGVGVWSDSDVSLAHARLAILDPDPRSDQPLWDNERRYVMVYNGEIYNFKELRQQLKDSYQFKTTGDSEVILAAYHVWGEAMLPKLNGMFALAIWDTQKKSLLLARDRVGIKPLYYYFNDGVLAFASELKALLELPIARELDATAFSLYLRLGYVPGGQTMLAGVQKLLPGKAIRFKKGGLEAFDFVSNVSEVLLLDYEIAKQTVTQTIDEAVARQLVSDKPLGIYLSGGIDSSVVLDAATKAGGEMKTFSVAFALPDAAEEERFNQDAILAAKTANYYGAEHHEYRLPEFDIISLFEKAVSHLDDPVANATVVAQLALAEFSKQSVDVVLGGDGGDELFGGYPRYRDAARARRYQQLLPSSLRSLLARLPVTALVKANYPGTAEFVALAYGVKDRDLARLVSAEYLRDAVTPLVQTQIDARQTFEDLLMEFDRQFWLVDESLLRTDRMTMAHGLEARVPLLDNTVVALSKQLPTAFKFDTRDTKKMLKAAYRERLPDYLFDQPKRGWFSPGAKWLREPAFREFTHEVLQADYYGPTAGLFEWSGVHSILDEHQQKLSYHYLPLWRLLTFQLWAKQYKIRVT